MNPSLSEPGGMYPINSLVIEILKQNYLLQIEKLVETFCIKPNKKGRTKFFEKNHKLDFK